MESYTSVINQTDLPPERMSQFNS